MRLFVGLLLALPAAAEEAPAFVLEVGERVYEIRAEQPREIETPDGDTLTVTLQPNTPRTFEGHGLRFDYPRAMRVRTTEDEGVVTLTCESEQSPRAVIQVYTLDLQPDAVRKALFDGLKSQVEQRGGEALERSGESVTRMIAGADRPGNALAMELDERTLEAEVYAFQQGERVVALLLQYNADEAAMAERHFRTLCESLE